MAEARALTFSDFETLAAVRMVVGTDDSWIPESASAAVTQWLSTDNLVAHLDRCSDYCKAATAVALLGAGSASYTTQATTILTGLLSRLRVTGRTAYISAGHAGHATDMRSNALTLTAISMMPAGQRGGQFASLTVGKLANYVAQGGADSRWGTSGSDAVLRGFALSDYDGGQTVPHIPSNFVCLPCDHPDFCSQRPNSVICPQPTPTAPHRTSTSTSPAGPPRCSPRTSRPATPTLSRPPPPGPRSASRLHRWPSPPPAPAKFRSRPA